MKVKAALATINRVPFRCQVCQSELFYDREVKLFLSGVPNLQWSKALVCERCGYLHLFLNNAIEFWTPEDGYPQG